MSGSRMSEVKVREMLPVSVMPWRMDKEGPDVSRHTRRKAQAGRRGDARRWSQ